MLSSSRSDSAGAANRDDANPVALHVQAATAVKLRRLAPLARPQRVPTLS